MSSEMFENSYETDEDEQNAHTATLANLARHAVFQHQQALPDDCLWAERVYDILHEAAEKLGELSIEEARYRPGMLEVGRAYGAAFTAKHQAARAMIDAALSPSPGGG